jgi:hypothetical protein
MVRPVQPPPAAGGNRAEGASPPPGRIVLGLVPLVA